MTTKEGAQTRAVKISMGWPKKGGFDYLVITILVVTLKAVEGEGHDKRSTLGRSLSSIEGGAEGRKPSYCNIWDEDTDRGSSSENVKAGEWLWPCPARMHLTPTLREQ